MPNGDLPPLISALLHPSAYPHPVDRVELRQTHISFVLLAGDHVYKIKKPVNFGFLDFSTLAKRRYFCRQEVTLNSRLCPKTYLGVLPIRRTESGWSLGGRRGEIVEYAVHMRRLPAEGMMDHLLANGSVTNQMIDRLALRLADFHASSETSPHIARFGDRAIHRAWDENFQQWASYIGKTITREQDAVLRAYVDAFFAQNRDLLRSRVDNLRIRDCHGDLRSDAVCFADGLCIFDCIEFNRRFRYTDVAGDVGFLSMDLDYRGHPDVAKAFVDRYVEASDDKDLEALIDFYKCYRAAVRGKVEGFRLSQPEVPAAERREAQQAARHYFDLACRYAASLPPPLLVITCGLTASGKSTLARRLAELTPFDIVSSDIERKALAGLAATDRAFEPYGAGIYSPQSTERTYETLLDAARSSLQKGRSVIIDATFVRRSHRKAAAQLAGEMGAQFVCLQLEATGEAVRHRLDRRLREGSDPSDARWEIYVAQKRRFQPPSEVVAERLVAVDSSRPIEWQAKTVLTALRRLSPLSLPSSPEPS